MGEHKIILWARPWLEGLGELDWREVPGEPGCVVAENGKGERMRWLLLRNGGEPLWVIRHCPKRFEIARGFDELIARIPEQGRGR